MTEVTRVRVEHLSGSYAIAIGAGFLREPQTFASLGQGSFAAIVTNPTVAGPYAAALTAALRPNYAQVDVIELPDGEQYKTLATLEAIFDFLLARGCDRKTTLFALGGGVVGDMTGFAAASYMRGIDYVQIPTTLLAQTDSSVGGKTGVNHALGKNMIGAFHQPRLVVIDLDTLDTLAQREYVSGLAEVIKYGAVADSEFFAWLDLNIAALLARDKDALVKAVKRSCEIKASVVGEDEREAGLRAILNFGHTTAHAIENLMGYGSWLHGEAVGCGMAVAAWLSVDQGLLDRADAGRLVRLIERAGLPVQLPRLDEGRWLEAMRHDKKSVGGELRFVLLDRLGQAKIRAVEPASVSAALRACASSIAFRNPAFGSSS